jgi:signal transduction histidine kinase
LREQLDLALRSAAELQASVLAAGRPIPTRPGPQSFASFVAQVNRFVAQRDSAGRVTASNTPLAATLPLDSAAFAAALAGEPAWATVAWQETEARTIFLPAPVGSPADAAVVQVAAVLDPYRRGDSAILLRMMGLALLATSATFFGARWLAGAVTRLVGEIAAQAAAVQPGRQPPYLVGGGDFVELQGLVRVINDMLERQHRALEQQRRLTADVAHELRTPVTSLLGLVEVGLRYPRPPETYRHLLVQTQEELERLRALVESLVLLARFDAGQGELHLSEVDLAALAAGVVQRARARAGDRQIEVVTPAAAVPYRGDERMLTLLLDHLVDNIVRHTPDQSRARLTVGSVPGAVTLAAEDSGPGIPLEQLPYLFDRFFRGDASRSRSAGAGLGLTLVAAITRAHGGTVLADRSPWGGLRVTVTLPRAAR